MNPRDFPPDQSTKARLPFWNPYAYASFGPLDKGPWVDLFDIGSGVGGGESVKVLITKCDRDDWEIIPAPSGTSEETEQ